MSPSLRETERHWKTRYSTKDATQVLPTRASAASPAPPLPAAREGAHQSAHWIWANEIKEIANVETKSHKITALINRLLRAELKPQQRLELL
ncbi:hypothetical protein M514_02725 [Trichuris suis]|uniref:Uncharacterized protein n=1 Tax=Trichuris suis TaxID=68888 RepID=A0A085MGC4_9BILA|nr:hypothetical protein M513_02725 [Trichuris suis]KFD68802.1 hypothetical protein M514_02725 [Trichuris suis]